MTIQTVNNHYGFSLKLDDLEKWLRKAPSTVFEALYDIQSKRRHTTQYSPIFVFRGMSGVAHAIPLSLRFRKRYPDVPYGLVYVRKENEDAHGSTKWEYSLPVQYEERRKRIVPEAKRFALVFVDDFVDSGETQHNSITTAYSFINKFQPKFDERLEKNLFISCLSQPKDMYSHKHVGKICKVLDIGDPNES